MRKHFLFVIAGMLIVFGAGAQQFDETGEYVVPVVKGDSNDARILGLAGYAYYMSDNPRAAYSCYRRILVLDSNNISALHYLVLIRFGDDADEAIGYDQRLLQLQPARAVWWRIMGELSLRKQRPDTALAYFNQAYDLAPGDVKTVAGLAEVLTDQKNFARADRVLDSALSVDSVNPSLLKLRVRSAYLQQDYPLAILYGERVLRSGEAASQALTWLALSYYDLKQYPDCVRVCEYMLGIGLELEAVYYYEARAWAKLKNYPQSDSLLRIALSKAISKTAEWYYNDLGDNHESEKEYKQAVAHYDTAYYLFRDPIMLYTCGRICETELRNTALARKYYQRYLVLAKPVSTVEKEAYAYVRRRWGVAAGKGKK
jgi:tetratricopeptide (TPR) repeat protein